MVCSINYSHSQVGSDKSPLDLFTVGNLSAAGIQPGSTCSVDGCYVYYYLDGDFYNNAQILTPKDVCTIQGEMAHISNIATAFRYSVSYVYLIVVQQCITDIFYTVSIAN